jgi:rare lipoprotein A
VTSGRRRTALPLLGLLLAAGCASHRPVVLVPSPPPAVSFGNASWYGPGFVGKRTASGERFDMNALTAAHCCFPLGTTVRVTLLTNGKSVLVRINDRMPPNGKGRVIDLSHEAARRIGLIGPGTGRVRIEVVP